MQNWTVVTSLLTPDELLTPFIKWSCLERRRKSTLDSLTMLEVFFFFLSHLFQNLWHAWYGINPMSIHWWSDKENTAYAARVGMQWDAIQPWEEWNLYTSDERWRGKWHWVEQSRSRQTSTALLCSWDLWRAAEAQRRPTVPLDVRGDEVGVCWRAQNYNEIGEIDLQMTFWQNIMKKEFICAHQKWLLSKKCLC